MNFNFQVRLHATGIEESKDLSAMTLDGLMESLMALV